ncbi:hypothetical protein, partial [Roseospira visakhapatnamensis]
MPVRRARRARTDVRSGGLGGGWRREQIELARIAPAHVGQQPPRVALVEAEQKVLLERVAAWLPDGVKPVLMGDRFYGSP